MLIEIVPISWYFLLLSTYCPAAGNMVADVSVLHCMDKKKIEKRRKEEGKKKSIYVYIYI